MAHCSNNPPADGPPPGDSDDDVEEPSKISLPTVKRCDVDQVLPPGKDILVFMAHVEDLNHFYITRQDQGDWLDYIKYSLGSVLSFEQETYRPNDKNRRCNACAVRSPADDQWKRVQVVHSHPTSGLSIVRYIDHGNEDQVRTDHIKLVPDVFEHIPPLAIRCSLDLLKPWYEGCWGKDVINELRVLDKRSLPSNQQLDGGGMTARLVRVHNGFNIVRLKHAIGNSDWGAALIQYGLARRADFDDVSYLPILPVFEEEPAAAAVANTDNKDVTDLTKTLSQQRLNGVEGEDEEEEADPSLYEPDTESEERTNSDVTNESEACWGRKGNRTFVVVDPNTWMRLKGIPGPDPTPAFRYPSSSLVPSSRGRGRGRGLVQQQPRSRPPIEFVTTNGAEEAEEEDVVIGNLPTTPTKNPEPSAAGASKPAVLEPPMTKTTTPRSKQYQFTRDKITLPLPLDIIFSGNHFMISHAKDYNHFFVTLVKGQTEREIELLDEINSYFLAGAVKINHGVSVNDIVLIRHVVSGRSKPPIVYRGLITKKLSLGRCIVQNIDTGKGDLIELETEMYKMTPEIFQIPILCHEVIFGDVQMRPLLIYQTDFDCWVKSLKKSVFVVEPETLRSSLGKTIVHIKKPNESFGNTFLDEIHKLRVWNWENILNGGYCRNDDEICERAGGLYEATDMRVMDLRPGDEFRILIKNVVCRGDTTAAAGGYGDPDQVHPYFSFEPLLMKYDRIKRVLRNQIHRYMEKVQASRYFPSGNELVFLRPPPGQIGAGEWFRGIKVDPKLLIFYAVDTGVTYNANHNPGFSFRKMVVDFARIPHCLPHGTLYKFKNTPNNREIFKSVFTVGSILVATLKDVTKHGLFEFEIMDYKYKFFELGKSPDM